MLGNIWLPSVLIVTAIFSAGAMYKSYSDIQEAKQIQENYEIISNIKTLLAKQYNKNPQDITRDEIIANLPSGGNWEKVLLLDRNKDSNLLNKELVDEKGNFEISEDEKLKLLALKAKLKNITDISSITADSTTKKYTFEVGKIEKNAVLNDIEIEKSLTRAVNALGVEILYSGVTSPSSSFLDTILTKILEEFTPYDSMYQEFRTASEISVNTILDTSETLKRKKDYFKSKIKEKLEKNETAMESRLYLLLKDK
jgi:type II secretory pathway pseudopilin PulG